MKEWLTTRSVQHFLREEREKNDREYYKKRRRSDRRFRKAMATVLVASTIATAAYEIATQTPKQENQPSCVESPMTCTWDPVLTPTATLIVVPDRQNIPPSTNDRRR